MALHRLCPLAVLALTGCAAAQPPADHVYLGGLHSHTSYSDGSGLPEEAFAHARDQAHCDFFAITEHSHVTGIHPREPRVHLPPIGGDHSLYNGPLQPAKPKSLIQAANAATVDGSFVALYGQEFSIISVGNHMNVFDAPDVIQAADGHFDQLLAWVRQAPHFDTTGQAAILQFNHPEMPDRHGGTDYGEDDFGTEAAWVAAMDPLVCTIEVLNGPGTVQGEHHGVPPSAESAYKYYLGLGFHVAPTADQDNHYRTWGTFTTVRTGIIAPELTKAALLTAIRARHVYATSDQTLRVIARVNGHLTGDRVAPPGDNSELTIQVQITDDDEPHAAYQVEAYKGFSGSHADPAQAQMVPATGDGTFSVPEVTYTGARQYVYLKITQTNHDGTKDHAWTAPVWFEAGAGGGGGGVTPPIDESKFVASKNSSLYHTNPDCPAAKNIKPENRITGPAAKENRTPHSCPPTH